MASEWIAPKVTENTDWLILNKADAKMPGGRLKCSGYECKTTESGDPVYELSFTDREGNEYRACCFQSAFRKCSLEYGTATPPTLWGYVQLVKNWTGSRWIFVPAADQKPDEEAVV